MTTPDDGIVIAAQTRRIDGVITLTDLAQRLRQGPTQPYAQSIGADPDQADRLVRIRDLAERLAIELEQLPPA